MPTTTRSAGQHPAVGEGDAGDPRAGPLPRLRTDPARLPQSGHPHPGDESDTASLVQLGTCGGEFGSELGQQGQWGRLDDRDVVAEGSAGRRGLGTDEAAADHHDALRTVEQVGAQGPGVVESAQGVHTGRCGAGQPAGARTGGDDDAVAADGAAVRQVDSTAPGVESAGTDAEEPLRAELPGLLGVGQGEPVLGGTAGEEVLGQRGAVVGRVRLLADDHQPAVESLRAEFTRRVQPGEGGADHGHGPHEAVPFC